MGGKAKKKTQFAVKKSGKKGLKMAMKLAEDMVGEESAMKGPATGPKRPIKLKLIDRNSHDHKTRGTAKKVAVMQALNAAMFRELMSDESDVHPRYNFGGWVEGNFTVVAVGEDSAKFLKYRIRNVQKPWANANLDWVYASPKLAKVEVLIPGEPIPQEKFLNVVKQFDPRFNTQKWHQYAERPHELGTVVTYGLDQDSFKVLEKYNGFVPYEGKRFEFRVLVV